MHRSSLQSRLLQAASIVVLIAFSALTMPASAGQRSFVASTGSDFNPCTLQLPCRGFNTAIGATNPGGEVVILDTAGYGPMVINKSIKIIGPSGVYGGISVTGGVNPTTGIVINAASGDDITLRGLDISGVPGAAPLPLIGIDVQNAGAVHIEKSSVSNFTQDTSACINVNVASTVRVFIDDSFLRECRTGIYANGSAVIANRPSVIVDNTRIERGKGPVVSYGIWMQGFMDVTLRNSVIARQDVGIQFDNLLASGLSQLQLTSSEMTRVTSGLVHTNTSANAAAAISIVGSQITETQGAIQVTTSAPTVTKVIMTDSHVAYSGGGGISLAANGGGVTNLFFDMLRSQITSISNASLDVSATNGSRVGVLLRDSEISNSPTAGLKTSGTPGSYLQVSLVRSNLNANGTAIDHGFGKVRLDSSHVVFNFNDFVDNGSSNIVSNGYNMVTDNVNSSGLVYITPSVIGLE